MERPTFFANAARLDAGLDPVGFHAAFTLWGHVGKELNDLWVKAEEPAAFSSDACDHLATYIDSLVFGARLAAHLAALTTPGGPDGGELESADRLVRLLDETLGRYASWYGEAGSWEEASAQTLELFEALTLATGQYVQAASRRD